MRLLPAFCAVLPANALRVMAYRLVSGYRIGRGVRIDFGTWIDVRGVEFRDGARAGGFNLVKDVDELRMGKGARLQNWNSIAHLPAPG